MQLDELNVLIDKTATLMVQYERRGAVVEARLQQLATALDELGTKLPAVLEGAARDIVDGVPGEVSELAAAGLDRPLHDYRVRLQSAGDEVARSARSLAAQLGELQRLHRALAWKIVGALTFALALLVGGGAWLATRYAGIIRANQVAADLARAYHRADVVLCGKGELCANVEPGRGRYGERGQYVPVRQR